MSFSESVIGNMIKKDPIQKRLFQALSAKLKGLMGLLLLFIVLLALLSLVRNVLRISQSKEKIRESQERVEELKRESERLAREIEKVQSEVYIEAQLRDKLGLVKEGEIIVVLPEEEILRKLAPIIPEEEETLPDPIWRKWLKLFL